MTNRHTTLLLVACLATGLLLMQAAATNSADNAKKSEQGKEAAAEGEKGEADGEIKVEELLDKLAFPTALALRPGAGRGQVEIWIADSGARRVIRYDSQAEVKRSDAIVELGGEAEAVEGESPSTVGMMFLSRGRLLLASSGEAPLRSFDIDDAKLPLKGSDGKKGSPAKEVTIESLSSMARNPEGNYVLGSAGDSSSIYRFSIKGAELGPVELFRNATEGVESTNPRAITFSSKGYLVLGLAGDEEGESVLVFLDPYRAESPPVMALKTGLSDIAALAYHPKSGALYAADSAWGDANKGGIYRLDAKSVEEGGDTECEAVLIAKLPYATALEFDSEGNLYALSAGAATPGDEPQGKLVKVTGQL